MEQRLGAPHHPSTSPRSAQLASKRNYCSPTGPSLDYWVRSRFSRLAASARQTKSDTNERLRIQFGDFRIRGEEAFSRLSRNTTARECLPASGSSWNNGCVSTCRSGDSVKAMELCYGRRHDSTRSWDCAPYRSMPAIGDLARFEMKRIGKPYAGELQVRFDVIRSFRH